MSYNEHNPQRGTSGVFLCEILQVCGLMDDTNILINHHKASAGLDDVYEILIDFTMVYFTRTRPIKTIVPRAINIYYPKCVVCVVDQKLFSKVSLSYSCLVLTKNA